MIYAVDFDGTMCANRYPAIGEPREPVLAFLRRLKREGHQLILWTCRVGKQLEQAVAWSKEQGIEFDEVNVNLPQTVQRFGDDARKVYADYYIDDRCLWPKETKMTLGDLLEALDAGVTFEVYQAHRGHLYDSTWPAKEWRLNELREWPVVQVTALETEEDGTRIRIFVD